MKHVVQLHSISTPDLSVDRDEAAALRALAVAYRRASTADRAFLLAVAEDLGRPEDLELELLVKHGARQAPARGLRLVQGGRGQRR